MRVWVTKYALTQGVFAVDVEQSENGLVRVVRANPIFWLDVTLSAKEYVEAKEQVEPRVRELQRLKVAAAKRQLAKAEAALLEPIKYRHTGEGEDPA